MAREEAAPTFETWRRRIEAAPHGEGEEVAQFLEVLRTLGSPMIDGPAVTFAGYRLPVPASVLEAKEGLDGYFGKKVILGIRPSDFEDAAMAEASWPRIPISVGVTEELGTEIHAIFTIDAPPVEHASITQATSGDDEEETGIALIGNKSLWTARVSARSAVRPGQSLELAIDTSRLHFFDPESGLAIGHPLASQELAAAKVA